MCQRTSHRTHQFILAKAFEVPRNFSRKVSLVEVWGDAPTDNARKKHGNTVLFYFIIICWNCVPNLALRSSPKSSLKIRKTFAPNYTTLLWQNFWVSKGLFTKSPLVIVTRRNPRITRSGCIPYKKRQVIFLRHHGS